MYLYVLNKYRGHSSTYTTYTHAYTHTQMRARTHHRPSPRAAPPPRARRRSGEPPARRNGGGRPRRVLGCCLIVCYRSSKKMCLDVAWLLLLDLARKPNIQVHLFLLDLARTTKQYPSTHEFVLAGSSKKKPNIQAHTRWAAGAQWETSRADLLSFFGRGDVRRCAETRTYA